MRQPPAVPNPSYGPQRPTRLPARQISANIRKQNQATRKPTAFPVAAKDSNVLPEDTPTDTPDTAGGGGGGGGGGGIGVPAFDVMPYDAARGRVNLQTDAARKLIAQMQTELAASLQQRAAEYQQAASKLQQDLAGYGQAAQQADMSQVQKVQQDLAQQGVAGQGVAAQAQVQEQARAQAQARQQDYLARLAQISQQSQSDRRANANTMFAGLNSQAEMQRNALLGAIDAQQLQAQQAALMARRGGGGGRGGGGRGGGGSSSDITDADVLKQVKAATELDAMTSPYELSNWAYGRDGQGGFLSTLTGTPQDPVKNALSGYLERLRAGDIKGAEQFAQQSGAALQKDKSRNGKYNFAVWQQGRAQASAAAQVAQERMARLQRFMQGGKK